MLEKEETIEDIAYGGNKKKLVKYLHFLWHWHWHRHCVFLPQCCLFNQ